MMNIFLWEQKPQMMRAVYKILSQTNWHMIQTLDFFTPVDR